TWTGALYTASDGKAEPQRAAPAIAEAARRHGAAILTQCAVRGIETAGGRVSAAVTEKGRIACDTVVRAGGAWFRLFCGNLGVEEWRRPRCWGLDEASPFEAVRVLDPEPARFVVERARTATAEAFPVFRDAVVAESWGGMIDVMPDAIPVISPVESLPGFFIA